MLHPFRTTLLVVLLAIPAVLAENGKYSLEQKEAAPPKELDASIQKVLSAKAIQLKDGGKVVAEFWFRKQVPARAPANAKAGIDYRDVPETTVLGAVRVAKDWRDYRKQPIPAGVYTMRLGYQPQDGDHMGTAPYPNFVVFLAAKVDPKVDTMDTRGMIERSAFSIERSHPAVFLLFPTKGKTQAAPKLVHEANEHEVLYTQTQAEINGQPSDTPVGIGLVVVGHANE